MKMVMSPQDIFSCDIHFKLRENILSAFLFAFMAPTVGSSVLQEFVPVDIIRLKTMVLFALR